MEEDYSIELKELLKRYSKEEIEFGKPEKFILPRIKATKEEIQEEILNCDNLSFVQKQEKDGEIRYALFFVYNKRKGRQYIITFRDNKIRMITVFPLGRKTLRKYKKKGLYR